MISWVSTRVSVFHDSSCCSSNTWCMSLSVKSIRGRLSKVKRVGESRRSFVCPWRSTGTTRASGPDRRNHSSGTRRHVAYLCRSRPVHPFHVPFAVARDDAGVHVVEQELVIFLAGGLVEQLLPVCGERVFDFPFQAECTSGFLWNETGISFNPLWRMPV